MEGCLQKRRSGAGGGGKRAVVVGPGWGPGWGPRRATSGSWFFLCLEGERSAKAPQTAGRAGPRLPHERLMGPWERDR